MKTLLFVSAILSFIPAGCGEGPSAQNGGVIPELQAIDIPIYDAETDGLPVDPTQFQPNIQAVWKKFDPNPYIEKYHENNGHYPENYDEFKTGVLEPNGLGFPQNMPIELGFRYDEEKHRVVIVRQTSAH